MQPQKQLHPIFSKEEGKLIFFNDLQSLNALFSIIVIDEWISISSILVHPSKQPSSITFTDLGIWNDFKLVHAHKVLNFSTLIGERISTLTSEEHREKARPPIVLVDSGTVIIVKLMQLLKTPHPIDVTDDGISICLIDEQ